MMSKTKDPVFHIGDRVRVPWGADQVEGEIVEGERRRNLVAQLLVLRLGHPLE